jgi:hypothetical protein
VAKIYKVVNVSICNTFDDLTLKCPRGPDPSMHKNVYSSYIHTSILHYLCQQLPYLELSYSSSALFKLVDFLKVYENLSSIHSLSALGYKYIFCNLIVNVAFDYISILTWTYENVLHKVPNSLI